MVEQGDREQALWVNSSIFALPEAMSKSSTYGGRCDSQRLILAGRHAILSPWEAGVPTKANTFDEAIAVVDNFVPWVGEALLRQAARQRCRHPAKGESSPLWHCQPKSISDSVEAYSKRLGSADVIFGLIFVRHIGPSRDVHCKARTLLNMHRRGRWDTLCAAKHYEPHGRLQEVSHHIPELVRMGIESRICW